MAEIKTNRAQKTLIEKEVIAFSTCEEEKPNVIAIACCKVVAPDKILITDNFMNKTKKIF
jgi:predicted pyridoxine 5'-phosphate oxidase superfamily flavin-nucleotide-binding protein